MASFSIHELLGISKDNRTTAGAGRFQRTDSEGFLQPSPPSKGSNKEAGAAEEEEEDHDIDVESFEEDGAHQLVTVEVRTVRHRCRLDRNSSSRKRQRTEEAKERESTPESEDDHPPSQRKSTSPEFTKDSRSSKRLRTAFTTAQLRTLEYFFRMCPYPDSYGREQIARATGIEEAKIQVWFQNRRARYRKREKPMEPQKSPVARQSPSTSISSLSPHSMMQAFFTAAALSGSKLPTAPTLPSPQQFLPPSTGTNPFFPAMFTAMPPYFTLPTFPKDPMAVDAANTLTPQSQSQVQALQATKSD